ncbi:FeoB small GTPase domain-containing protein [Corynebacterium sp.]|nr:FeoB small GTPase domain-containing protein [Corynebacterium sp.]MDU6013135.1 FeoB small GTPase domain-containing protein [Corynebacterium sp.]
MARKTAAPSCHSTSSMRIAKEGTPVLALVGAPNSGKSTLFNALTGAKVQTGNWPGTSVEISRGLWNAQPEAFDIIDLPGAYSLDPMSPDEEFTRDMLVEAPPCERPDVVVVLVDATAPARGLNLAFQIAEHPYRVVIGVTKEDIAKQQGISIDTSALSHEVGIPVVSVNGRRRENLDALEREVARAMHTDPRTIRPNADLDQRFVDLDAA